MNTHVKSFSIGKAVPGWLLFFLWAIAGGSCKKDLSCESCQEKNAFPRAVAGPDKTIELPMDSVWLDGTASGDPDGSISAYRWREIAGPSPSAIVSATASATRVRALSAGQYQFELTVTDNGGLSANDTIRVTVRSMGQQAAPPVACAGPDQSITPPVNTVILDGRCSSDPDSDIDTYLWTNVSGPASFQIANPSQPQTQVTGLTEGSFVFLLTVRDKSGLSSSDTVRVTVKPLLLETDSNDVYVAGNENSAPKYWKNGQGVELKISDYVNGHATAITVEGNDVYVAGWEGDYLDMRNNRAKYWKNGQEVFLTGNTGAGAYAIAVSGNDVFVAGWELKSQPGISMAIYWKNGVAVALTDGSETAEATDIAVVGADVYVSGYEGHVARVWRNGQLFWSADAGIPSYASGIVLNGADVYLAGVRAGKAVYWKNGQVFMLSTGDSRASSICVRGTDLYVAGEQGSYYSNVARYWKNGQETILSDPQETMIANDIYVEGNDVYVTGFDYNASYRGGYWKNGQFVQVGQPQATQISSIVVRRR
jgi:hypothetical protein